MAFSPEHTNVPLEAPSSFDSDKGDDEILSILQSNPQSCTRSPLRTALGKAFELASKQPAAEQPSNDESHVKVFLRLRPTAEDETSCIEVGSDGCSVRATAPPPINQKKEFKDARDYSFTKVLDANSSQSDVFDSAASDIVKSFCDNGKSGLIFTYGVTNAGKSYTVLGNQSNPGLLPMSLEKVCTSLNVEDQDILTISYMEIYNEQIYDLLESSIEQQTFPATNTRTSSFNSAFSIGGGSFSEKPRKNLQIRDRGGKVVVEGLSRHNISSADEAMTLIEAGSKERQTCSHNLNADSSRSHCVCSIELVRKGGQMSPEELSRQIPAILFLVDLAGSERGERTGAGGVSKKQSEANSINTSLFTLMTCLGSLRESSGGNGSNKRGSCAMSTARYRESKLTRLLAPHLSGNSLGPGGAGGTCMIVNANPRGSDFVETCYVLSQTAPCTKIKIKASKSSSSAHSLLAAAAKFDKNGRRIIKGAMGNSKQQGQHKKRSLVEDNAPNRRARLESNDSYESHASSSTTFDLEEFNALKAENKLLKVQLEEARNEAETVETAVREECAEEMEKMMNTYFNNGSLLRSNSGLSIVEENDDASVSSESSSTAPVQNDYLQSARKKKREENLQRLLDDLHDRCDDLEDELSRYTAENKTLTTALALARKESDANLKSSKGETAVPERWIMLDFITQLLTAPDTIDSEVFEMEANALKAALTTVSFSSPMRRCADFEQFGSKNDKIEKIGMAIRQALNLGNISTAAASSSSVDAEVVTAPKIDTEEQQNEVLTMDEAEMAVDEAEMAVDQDEMAVDQDDEEHVAKNPLIFSDEVECANEVQSKTGAVPAPLKVITQLQPIDPNSPHKARGKDNEKGENIKANSGKYSPSVIGNMSKRIREKAVKKTKKEKVVTASPRRTRSSTLFIRA